MPRRKLIEVALPLEAINKQSAREKSIRHGHPSTLHLWWARRPLATARAVLFAQLVDDPSNFEDTYRAEAEAAGEDDVEAAVEARVSAERARLFDLIERMVDWDNLGDEALFDRVRAEIMRSTDGNPPAILDPFAGGGTIPLEAQRLGLEAHASDLNPVAVLINKALIEIPPKFADREPVFPGAAGQRTHWPKATGLAEDVRRYGEWMRDEAQKRIGHLYPKATLPDGSEANVIAWIWARTVTCPNPACGIEMPLVRSWWLGKKKGKEAYVVPTVVDRHVEYSIAHDLKSAPRASAEGTVGRNGAACVSCKTAVPLAYLRTQGQLFGLGTVLIATVAERARKRVYLDPTAEAVAAADVPCPPEVPFGELTSNPRDFKTPNYGLRTFASLFTNRQLTVLTTLSDLVGEARERIVDDAIAGRALEGARPNASGVSASAYADAIATYLGQAVSRTSDLNNSLVTWSNSRDQARNLFARQAIPMAWDYVEVSPFADAAGDLRVATASIADSLSKLPISERAGRHVLQADAATRSYVGVVVSTDPPYYDNIGYSDLSDFFYVWLRRALRAIHPELLATMLVPKAEELVANPYRHGGRDGAKTFFERGFEEVFARARATANPDFPITVYYAFRQSETDIGGQASTGWETILGGIVHSGWVVTATWPVRSERGGRMISVGTNALASSIVLALRPRPEDAPVIDRRGLLTELRDSLPKALRELQAGSIAPVDMAQAAIGPGMAVFSKYSRVVEPSGDDMSVRDALRHINAMLDEVLGEQEGDFDGDTRWCVTWFEGHGFDAGAYGEAETLANAKNASIAGLARGGVLTSGAGRVKLLAHDELAVDYDPLTDDRISLWEIVMHIARALSDENGGLAAAGRILHRAESRGIDLTAAKELSYLLYSIAEKRGMTAAGIVFNALGSSWPDVIAAARAEEAATPAAAAQELDFDGLEG